MGCIVHAKIPCQYIVKTGTTNVSRGSDEEFIGQRPQSGAAVGLPVSARRWRDASWAGHRSFVLGQWQIWPPQ
jgi:hypothetical protein